jgi:hypothetical protein
MKIFKIVINSHINGNVALNHLLESMKIHKEYYDYEIIVIIGGHYNNPDYEILQNENIRYIKCNHNSIDFTGLITLNELYRDNINDYYLYLHDTCKVGEKFFKIIQSIDLTNVSSIKIIQMYSMNIGIYSQKLINTFTDFLSHQKNINENELHIFKTMGIYNEDYIFKSDNNNIVLNNYNGGDCIGPLDYYNTGTMRIVEYYPNLDIYKMKANWHINSCILTV